MNCEKVRDSLVDFEAGELSTFEAEKIGAHLASCPGCQIEHERVGELVADLRHAAEAVRARQPFALPAAAPSPRPRALVVIAAVAAVWALLLTTAMLWPSLTAHLAFLPVGKQLSAATQTGSSNPTLGRYPLASVPPGALARIVALFGRSHRRAAPGAPASSDLAELLPRSLDIGEAGARLLILGPVVSVRDDRVRLKATMQVAGMPTEDSPPRRHELLITLVRDAERRWQVVKVEVVDRI